MLSDLMQSDGGPDDGGRKLLRPPTLHPPGSRGRITASSFRLLTAKLQRKDTPESVEPNVTETAILELEMAPAEAEPAIVENLASAEPVQEISHEPELAEELQFESAAAFPDFGLPVFRPLEPLQSAAQVETEPGETAGIVPATAPAEYLSGIEPVVAELNEVAELAPVDTAAEAEGLPAIDPVVVEQAEEAEIATIAAAAEDLPDIEPAGAAAEPELELPVEGAAEEPVMWQEDVPVEILSESAETVEIAPDAIEVEGAAEPSAVVVSLGIQPLAGEAPPKSARVVDALLKTIADAIYCKPSAAERAVFLHDMAELGETALVTADARASLPPPRIQAPAQLARPVPVVSAEEPLEPLPLSSAIAARIGPSSSLLRNNADKLDVFAKDAASLALADPKPQETAEADEETGDLALTLLDMMSAGAGTALPQERALAADTLLRILARIPFRQLLNVVERVAIMQAPPPLLVAKLIRDPRPEVVAPLLERCMHITDQDLMAAATEGDMAKQRMIARRRTLSTVLADHLIVLGDPSVMLTLIRNPGASFSHDAFYILADMAAQHHGLLAPLATRADLPPPVAFELFWYVPQELRRFIFSRFLTDSETLNKILRITLATHGGGEGEVLVNDTKFPDRKLIDQALALAAGFKLDEAAQSFAEIGGISRDTVTRILADREGEPLTVLLKAMGYGRGKFSEAMEKLQVSESGVIRPGRVVEELQSIFDGLSFNKARILLTYWDWFVRKAGPYAPRN